MSKITSTVKNKPAFVFEAFDNDKSVESYPISKDNSHVHLQCTFDFNKKVMLYMTRDDVHFLAQVFSELSTELTKQDNED